MPWTAAAMVVLIVLVAVGDLLIFDVEPGINLWLNTLAIVAGVLVVHASRLEPRAVAIALAACLAAMLPLVEAASLPGMFCALVGIGIVSLVASGKYAGLVDLPLAAVRFALLAPFRLLVDGIVLISSAKPASSGGGFLRAVLVWVVPAVLAVVFIGLFSAANPIIESALGYLSPESLFAQLQPVRIVFWVFLLVLIWPFLRPQLLSLILQPKPEGPALPAAESLIFGRAAILRSLIVFNVIFAFQTGLDLTYLWGGISLPDGMSYAHYAHRGAYPLIATALLAAGFVLAAMPERGGAAEGSVWIRRLVYLWVGQNVLLVLSSIFRLWLYVGVYSLTELRLAAGIWMVLVAAGLVLICLRIALRRSNLWLIAMNLYALGFAIWFSAFLDFPAVISRFNVEHSLEVTGEGEPLDLYYLSRLGPGAIPAFDVYLDAIEPRNGPNVTEARLARNELAVTFMERPRDWRSWSFRDWRLEQYLLGEFADRPATDRTAPYLR
jgi:hypothetical protein